LARELRAWYVSQVLDALTSVPEVWSKNGVLFLPMMRTTASLTTLYHRPCRNPERKVYPTIDTTNEIFAGNQLIPLARTD